MPELHSRPLPAWTWPTWPLHARSLAVSSPIPALLPAHSAFFAEALHLFPLVRRQLVANGKQKSRIRPFQIAPSLNYLVDLSCDGCVIRGICAHQRLHRQLSLFEVRLQIDQLRPMLQHDGVHRLPLIVGQLQPLNGPGIVPPAILHARWSECPLHWRLVAAKSRANTLPAAEALSESRSSHQYSRYRQYQLSCSTHLHLHLPHPGTFLGAHLLSDFTSYCASSSAIN
jgi:hypothetical protein